MKRIQKTRLLQQNRPIWKRHRRFRIISRCNSRLLQAKLASFRPGLVMLNRSSNHFVKRDAYQHLRTSIRSLI